jgi:hypothetical protein
VAGYIKILEGKMIINNCDKENLFIDENGIIKEINNSKMFLGIFLYNNNEDEKQISGTTPLLFDDYYDLVNYLESKCGKKDLEEWNKRKLKIIIRSFKAITLS